MKFYLLLFSLLFLHNAIIHAGDSTQVKNTIHKETFASIHRDNTLPKREKIKRYGGIIGRFMRAFNDIDTNYITPQRYHFTTMLQETSNFEYYKLKSDNEGQSITFAPRPSYKVGPYIGYHWFFIGWSIDPSSFGNGEKTNKTEFEMSLYSSMIGCDLIYRRTGEDFRIVRAKGFGDADNSTKNVDFNGMKVNLTGINLYYIFNHQHFSYPAAFSQSTVQRRSCGTWKAGVAYTRHNISYDYTQLPNDLIQNTEHPLPNDMKFNNIKYEDISLSIGYAYNWVFTRNCLFGVSLAPAIGYKRTKGDYEDKTLTTKEKFRNFFSLNRFNLDYTARAGLVWNNTKFFGGASVIVHSYNYWKNSFSSSNTFGTINVYVGLNFIKQKRHPVK